MTGKDVTAPESHLGKPIGMQDFDRSGQRKSGDLKKSKHLAYHMYLSTRNMDRIGLLMLRNGNWGGNQVASKERVKRITSLYTLFNEMNPPNYRSLGTGNRWGYGYMWWVWDAPNSPGPMMGAFTGTGAGGQYITIIPELDMVIAHKTDTGQISLHRDGKKTRSVTGRDYDAVLRMLLSAALPPGY